MILNISKKSDFPGNDVLFRGDQSRYSSKCEQTNANWKENLSISLRFNLLSDPILPGMNPKQPT